MYLVPDAGSFGWNNDSIKKDLVDAYVDLFDDCDIDC